MRLHLNSYSQNESFTGKKSLLPYATARRRLGICYVGAIVSFSCYALASGLVVQLCGEFDRSAYHWFRNTVTFTLALELLSLPFDLIGFRIERLYRKTSESLFSYMLAWCRAAFKHGMLLVAFMLFFSYAVSAGGIAGSTALVTLLSIFLIWKQGEAARFLSGLVFEEPDQNFRAKFVQNRASTVGIVIARTTEKGFTGGIIGFPGAEDIVIPSRWLEKLSERELWTEITRRNVAISSGSRSRGVMWALIFTVCGSVVASAIVNSLLGLTLSTSAGVISTSLVFTLWSFIGLLILPFASQQGVIETDQRALTKGVTRDLLLQTISGIDAMMEDEAERTNAVQLIFHPIPTPGRRAQALDGATVLGAWNLARYAVWLSIAGLGLLGRAVHCNAGRPALWCILPAD